MSKKITLYLCDKKREECNHPCYKYCRLTHDINHAVKDDKGKPIIESYLLLDDLGDAWPRLKEVNK